MAIYDSIEQTIGDTPLVRLNRINPPGTDIFVKIERTNPGGSIKDRAVLSIIKDAEARGVLKKGGTIVEPTSGNTGIGLAAMAISRGYRVILTMPASMSEERKTLLRAYGAELVLTDAEGGMSAAIEKAEELHRTIPNSFIAGQFENPANPAAHYKTTGPEIWRDSDGLVDIFVAGVGTGGTISGVARYLKEKNPNIRIVAVEPAASPLLSGGKAGPHGLQGIGANFVPKNYDASLVDEIIPITETEAYNTARLLARTEGVLVGITSGAALRAADMLAQRPENHGKTIVALLPDDGGRYLSTDLWKED